MPERNSGDMGELKDVVRGRAQKKAVVFDLDDTLTPNTYLYDNAYREMQELLSTLGFDPKYAKQKMTEIDIARAKANGFSAERFPTSMVETYRFLCEERKLEPDPKVEAELFKIGNRVFEGPWVLYPGAKRTLEELRRNGFFLVLLTAGDKEVQARKIDSLGLRRLFDVIEIVGMKNVEAYTELIKTYGLDPEKTTMVGNGLKSDILHARRAGINAIHVPAETWAFESLDEQQMKELRDLGYKRAENITGVIGALEVNSGASKSKIRS
jgi:putative hydrolase of the HAD superfamily